MEANACVELFLDTTEETHCSLMCGDIYDKMAVRSGSSGSRTPGLSYLTPQQSETLA